MMDRHLSTLTVTYKLQKKQCKQPISNVPSLPLIFLHRHSVQIECTSSAVVAGILFSLTKKTMPNPPRREAKYIIFPQHFSFSSTNHNLKAPLQGVFRWMVLAYSPPPPPKRAKTKHRQLDQLNVLLSFIFQVRRRRCLCLPPVAASIVVLQSDPYGS